MNFRPRWLYVTDPEECRQLEIGYNEYVLSSSDPSKQHRVISATDTMDYSASVLATPGGRVPLKRVHFLWLWKGDDTWVAYSQLASAIIQTSYQMREPWVDLTPAALGMGGGLKAEYRVLFAKMHQHKIANEQRYRRVAYISSPEAPCLPLTIPLIYNPPKERIVYPDYWEPFKDEFEYYRAVNVPLTSDEAKKIDYSLNKSIFPGGRK